MHRMTNSKIRFFASSNLLGFQNLTDFRKRKSLIKVVEYGN